MDWGMENRLSRIIRPDTGRAVMLAIDHGYFLGPLTRLEEPGKTVEPLLPYTDSLMLTRGVLRNCIDPKSDMPVVLRVSGGNSIVGPALPDEELTVAIEDAVRLNVSAVALSIYVGTEHEHQTLTALSDLVDAAYPLGIPTLAVTAVGKELEKRDARYLGLCCRIAAELGAQVVKTYYCEDFDKVAGSCPVPIVIAGGPKMETELDAMRMIHRALEQGAIGVDFGRNVWQSDHPVAMIAAVRALVHEGKSAEEAHDLFQSLKN